MGVGLVKMKKKCAWISDRGLVSARLAFFFFNHLLVTIVTFLFDMGPGKP